MPDDLTEAMRAALEAVPDEWTVINEPTREGRFSLTRLSAMELIERRMDADAWRTRRTALGRAALENRP